MMLHSVPGFVLHIVISLRGHLRLLTIHYKLQFMLHKGKIRLGFSEPGMM
jgi:hypothetical protein